MQVTGLSGGQSRALMIADTAYLSASPIVLIDEIENAGINRKQAIELLVRTEKIVVIATHDPVLALSADRRIAIRNGGIAKVLQTSAAEKMRLIEIDRMNEQLMSYREKLRAGEVLD
jgi:ABC-type lipoprotein export system ATPase subunit